MKAISFIFLVTCSSIAIANDADLICEKAIHERTDESFMKCLQVSDNSSGSTQRWIAELYQMGLYPPFNRDSDGKINKINPSNDEEQKKWLIKAALNKNPSGVAALDVGNYYYYGNNKFNITKNYLKAFQFYKIAAANDVPWGALKLSTMYAKGQGVPTSIEYAYAWDAIALGMNPLEDLISVTRDELNEFEKIMSPKQINHAQQISSQCLESKFKKCELLSNKKQ